jgi:osmotically-inducible protein OsmY
MFDSKARNVLGASILICAVLSLGACNRAQRQDDKTITREIQAELYRDVTLKTRDISIIAQDGVVVLSGQVNSEDERAAAEHLAARVAGVKQVTNQLAVVGPSPIARPSTQEAAGPERPKGAAAPP